MARIPNEEYNHVLKYTSIFGGVQGLNILIGLVRNKLVAAILGTSGMGLASLFNSVVNFVSQSTNLGISFSAVKHMSEIFESGDAARIERFVSVIRLWSLITAVIGTLVCAVAGNMLSQYTFSWGSHTLHFVLLSPVVGMLAITGGETALLKGARRLQSLATIQIISVFAALVVSVPVYWRFGESGIVPVIVSLALITMLITLRHSLRLFPLHIRSQKGILGEGFGMVRLGLAFVAAGILGSGADMVVRSYLNVAGYLDVVGLYNAGYMITITYAGLVFSAMETDYFPRLSAVNHDVTATNLAVNRQIEVSVLLLSPMLAALMIGLPIFIPLLYSKSFLPVVAMTQVAVFAMYLKAVTLPVSYLTLAKGDSVAYMVLEGVSDVAFVAFVVMGWRWQGLLGVGVGLVACYLIDLVQIYAYAYVRYHYSVSRHVVYYVLLQFPLALVLYAVTRVEQPWIYWTAGIALCMVSAAISLVILYKKTSLWQALMRKLKIKN